ncbi:hypothetical protein SAMN05518801_109130 [Novosphingobium sp. CF614]|uniref:hypothetical protein n=1 Tax=Novosphingobium sp. CF614 TaxID=1884364 RepID=UPI0008E98C4C|nr:hypothetical protein [Novosphingobium sp. CF614]SFG18729.1 hypothetical protein SAMN05518801_109130 [Novosphingobium sp. CF614]
MIETIREKAPWYFWVVAVLSLLWDAFGCLDFTMTVTRNPAYLAQFPPEIIDFIDSFPMWATAVWALGVWGALTGSVLLLLRSRWAVAAFAASLLGLALSTVYQVTADMPEAMTAGVNLVLTLVIWAAAIALLWFAARMRARGVLR